jgi:hypothetical protein
MPIVSRVHGFAMPGGSVILDLQIEYDENGYILLCRSRDGSVDVETWHTAYQDAVEVAVGQYGVEPSRWKT